MYRTTLYAYNATQHDTFTHTTHTLTHSCTHAFTHSGTHLGTHTRTHPRTHARTHAYACMYTLCMLRALVRQNTPYRVRQQRCRAVDVRVCMCALDGCMYAWVHVCMSACVCARVHACGRAVVRLRVRAWVYCTLNCIWCGAVGCIALHACAMSVEVMSLKLS